MKNVYLSTFVFVVLLIVGFEGFAKPPRRVLIFSADIGMGHESAAKAIKAGIQARDPEVYVEIKNVREFSDSFFIKWFNETAYQLMVKHKPEMWDSIYNKSMERAHTANSVSEISKPYDEQAVLSYINEFKPDVIINTFNLGVETLISLREKNLLSKDIKIGWIHTDYVIERYHMLLSRDIDMTFLAHPAMREAWIEQGIPAEKVITTGMPVNVKAFEPLTAEGRTDFLRSAGLDPEKKTVVIMSGKEGVGNFADIVDGIAQNLREEIQVVAICGKSTRNINRLNRMKAKLPANIHLTIEGFIPNDKVMGYVRSANTYVTKSGGLSPTEAFVIGLPLVLLDINGGQERYNSRFFKKEGLASVVAKESEAGAAVKTLLGSPAAQSAMVAAQRNFRESINLGAITRFVFGDAHPERPPTANTLRICRDLFVP